MAENNTGFTVTDRRKFTSEGQLREDSAATQEEKSAPVAETAQAAAPPPSPSRLESNQATAGQQPLADPSAVVNTDQDLSPEFGEEEGGFEGELPELTAQETSAQQAAYRQSTQDLDDMVANANPGVRRPPASEMNFDKLVQSIYMTAALQLGAGTQPNEQPRVDILGARQSIDMLNVLSDKTKGNLTEKEQRLLQNALFELRMTFLEITNAISSSAHAPPRPAGGAR